MIDQSRVRIPHSTKKNFFLNTYRALDEVATGLAEAWVRSENISDVVAKAKARLEAVEASAPDERRLDDEQTLKFYRTLEWTFFESESRPPLAQPMCTPCETLKFVVEELKRFEIKISDGGSLRDEAVSFLTSIEDVYSISSMCQTILTTLSMTNEYILIYNESTPESECDFLGVFFEDIMRRKRRVTYNACLVTAFNARLTDLCGSQSDQSPHQSGAAGLDG